MTTLLLMLASAMIGFALRQVLLEFNRAGELAIRLNLLKDEWLAYGQEQYEKGIRAALGLPEEIHKSEAPYSIGLNLNESDGGQK